MCRQSQICKKQREIHSRFILNAKAKHALNFTGSQDVNTLQHGSRWCGSTPLTLCHCQLQSKKLTNNVNNRFHYVSSFSVPEHPPQYSLKCFSTNFPAWQSMFVLFLHTHWVNFLIVWGLTECWKQSHKENSWRSHYSCTAWHFVCCDGECSRNTVPFTRHRGHKAAQINTLHWIRMKRLRAMWKGPCFIKSSSLRN